MTQSPNPADPMPVELRQVWTLMRLLVATTIVLGAAVAVLGVRVFSAGSNGTPPKYEIVRAAGFEVVDPASGSIVAGLRSKDASGELALMNADARKIVHLGQGADGTGTVVTADDAGKPSVALTSHHSAGAIYTFNRNLEHSIASIEFDSDTRSGRLILQNMLGKPVIEAGANGDLQGILGVNTDQGDRFVSVGGSSFLAGEWEKGRASAVVLGQHSSWFGNMRGVPVLEFLYSNDGWFKVSNEEGKGGIELAAREDTASITVEDPSSKLKPAYLLPHPEQ